MVKFVSDNKEIEKGLRRLYKQVVANGGLVYDGLTIGCEKGSFKITCDAGKPEGERILVLPKECLLPVDKFRLALKGNAMVIEGHDKDLTRGQVAMMKTMIELYNLTGKIQQQKKTSTLSLFYRDRELFDLIMKSFSRQGVPFLEKMITTKERDFYLDSFFKSRVLGFREAPAAGGKGGERRVKMLMPIVDFINHHPNVAGFATSFKTENGLREIVEDAEETSGGDGVAVVKSCPVDGSDECFVSYGPYDAADLFIHYNYVETQTNFVRSVPMLIKTPNGGTIKILSTSTRPVKKLPDPVKDLKFFVPQMKVEKDKALVTLSFLLIPQAPAPRALRRVLRMAVNQAGMARNDEQAIEAVRFAERRVIEENLRHYKELAVYLELYEPKPSLKLIVQNARDMARAQLEKIRAYPFFDEIQADTQKRKKAAVRA